MSIFSENLSCLSRRYPKIAQRITQNFPPSPIFVEKTQSGTYTYGVHIEEDPANTLQKKSKKYFHSRIDPIQEASRLAKHYEHVNSIIYIGLGSAKHYEQLLRNHRLDQLIIIEPTLSLFETAFHTESYCSILQDNRVNLYAEACPGDGDVPTYIHGLTSFLQSELVLLFTPTIRVHCLNNRKWLQTRLVEQLEQTCIQLLQQKHSDYGIMQHFGQRWQKNIIQNASYSPSPNAYAHIQNMLQKKALLLGAGPSLERYFDEHPAPVDHCIAATDSSIPFMMRQNQKINIVCSIDAQVYSYLHGNVGYPKESLYVSALSSYTPKTLKKYAADHVYILGPHPFEQYLFNHKKDLLSIPLYGTTVASFALVILKLFGIEQVQTIGCDFSYPMGKRYCRGTYNHIYDNRSSQRLHAFDAFACARLVQEGASIQENAAPMHYTTERLSAYKHEFSTLHAALFTQQTASPNNQLPTLAHMSEQRFRASQDFRGALSAIRTSIADSAASQNIAKNNTVIRACVPFAASILSRSSLPRDGNADRGYDVHREGVDTALRSALQKTKDYIVHALSDT